MVTSTRSIRIVTITVTAAARILDAAREPQFKLSARKVDTRNNPKEGTATVLKSRIGDSFGVTKARALYGAQNQCLLSS